MASSLRTKKPRTSGSQSKQGTSSSKSNPSNLTRLLANDDQRKVFEEHFHGRSIFTLKYGNVENFEFEDFLFPYLLWQQNLLNFCYESNGIYPELVLVFYCNTNLSKNLHTSHVKGKDIVLDTKTLSSLCCDIPNQGSTTGFGLVCDRDNYDGKEFYLSLCRISKEEIEQCKQQGFGETVKNKYILNTRYLKLGDRLLHYFLSYVILPKFSNHSQISDIELQLMYAMKYNIKIYWTQMIMRQMLNVRSSQSPLPYSIFITKILEHFSVSLDGETKVALNLRESKIDVEVVHKIGFSVDPIDRCTYKHRTDRPTVPTTQPEPTIPNPPDFHAQSSSSAAMSSNQMIMDELVSLRGYITTRMDALDTQNQQIHYELHRLSSRINIMDVDEDSSEPES
ncbi:hypothetical protein Lal_00039207 [Lupinus albus]|nr:hypothetical protein Lal_00039207 [Lupinus albus]